MNHFCDHQYTAFIGIDWADTKHDICLQAADSDQREFACINLCFMSQAAL